MSNSKYNTGMILPLSVMLTFIGTILVASYMGLVLNKKIKEKEKEEVIKLLNKLLESETLEEKLDFKPINDKKEKQNIPQQQFTPKLNFTLEESKIEDRYFSGIPIGEKTKKEISEKIVYTSNPKTNIKNLRSFLDRKGLLSHPSINKQEISKQITEYFGGNVSHTGVERYFAMFSQDSIEYQAFGKDDVEETNISGRKIRYYKMIPKEEKR